jgi:radical SAM superfamily enzyme YgiQ (UPF0313 family)
MMKRSRIEEAILLSSNNHGGSVNPKILNSLEVEIKAILGEFWVLFKDDTLDAEGEKMLEDMINYWWDEDE